MEFLVINKWTYLAKNLPVHIAFPPPYGKKFSGRIAISYCDFSFGSEGASFGISMNLSGQKDVAGCPGTSQIEERLGRYDGDISNAPFLRI